MGFFWFLYLAPFDHPCHLKSEVPPPPLGRILVSSTDCDVISFNGQGLKRSFQTIPNMSKTRSRTRRIKQKLV